MTLHGDVYMARARLPVWAINPRFERVVPVRMRLMLADAACFTPIQCADGAPTQPEAAKVADAHEKNAYLQSRDSEVIIDGMDKTAQGGKYPGIEIGRASCRERV